jgi:predicted small secreted protein
MKKFQEKIPIITLVLLCCTFLYTCNTNRNVGKVIKENKQLVTTVDSLKTEITILSDSTISASEFQTRLELEGYKASARNLYYNNAIIRTKERPDDVMHKFNVEIERLTKKLEK